MKNLRIIKIVSTWVLLGFVLVILTRCQNAETQSKQAAQKVEEHVKKDATQLKNKVSSTEEQAKEHFNRRITHDKALLELEQAKVHFVVENDRFKTQAALEKAKKHLESLEKTTDADGKKALAQLKSQIDKAGADVKKGESRSLDLLINGLGGWVAKEEGKMGKEVKSISNDLDRHRAELKAKRYLLKARTAATKKKDFVAARKYLAKADQEYQIAKQYAGDQYKAKVDKLRQDIVQAEKSIDNKEEKAFEKVDVIIIDLGKISVQDDSDYPYIEIP